MEIVVNDTFPVFFRAPPRTPLQLIKVLKVFESVDGASWGFVTKLNEIQNGNRLYVAENLQTRGHQQIHLL